jgi:hypothetical protein
MSRFTSSPHALRRPPAGHREQDPGLAQLAHRRHRAVGEDLVVRHQRAVDIGQDQPDAAALQEISPIRWPTENRKVQKRCYRTDRCSALAAYCPSRLFNFART